MKITIKTDSGTAACFVFSYYTLSGISFKADYLGEDSWIIYVKGATAEFALAVNDIVKQNCSLTDVEISK